MRLLQQISQGKLVLSSWLNDFVLLELLDDRLVYRPSKSDKLELTYLGFRTLEEWDPVLEVIVNYQLLQKAVGDA